MKGDIDPRLAEQLDRAGEEGDVEAVLLLSDAGFGGAGERLIARVAGHLHEQPAEVRHLPHLGAVYVNGSAKFVRHVIDDDQVVAATANDADVTAG
ncbi:MAG: hypothetical protein ACRDI2_03770 [Chloroflexota bacterium]